MLRILTVIAGIVFLTAAASPQSSALKKAFTGTIVSTYPDGRTADLWLNPNGTFVSIGRNHDRTTGRWGLRGEKVCFTRLVFTWCTKMPNGVAPFTTKAVTGETIQVRLAPGRQFAAR